MPFVPGTSILPCSCLPPHATYPAISLSENSPLISGLLWGVMDQIFSPTLYLHADALIGPSGIPFTRESQS